MFFNIQRWSLHDGPGIRTTLFFRGCPLRCRWCCNPESWAVAREPGDTSLEEALAIIRRDAVFYRASGGGVTFSGGEPFSRPGELARLADAAGAAGIETAVETCGYFDYDAAEPALELTDHLFIDLKHMDAARHRALTGGSNQPILRNIRRIDAWGKAFTVRIPLVRGLTDGWDDLGETARFCRDLDHLIQVELMPFHPLGQGKYRELNLPRDDTLAAPDRAHLHRIMELFRAAGLPTACRSPLL